MTRADAGSGFRRKAVVLAVVLGAALAACVPPDRPPRLLPPSFLSWIEPDTLRTEHLAPGVRYRFVWSPAGPWAVHLLQVELERCDLGLEVVRAPLEEGGAGGHATVSELVAGKAGARALAAVNGDFFTPEGTPLGPELAGNATRTLRARPVLAWRGGEPPWIGTARLQGDSLLVAGEVRVRRDASVAPGRSDPGTRDGRGAPGSEEASDPLLPPAGIVGGYPELLDDGVRVDSLLVSDNPGFAASRHPRTGVGWDPSERTLWIVVVDGRQGGYSVGMTLPELTGVFERLGATEALNLDGGGSSVMVVRGETVSRPSDEAGERPVVNALIVRRDRRHCPAGRGAVRARDP